MRTLKNVRALAASLGVLAMGAVAVSPAMAFDNVSWNWSNNTKQHTDVDVNVDVNVDSTGLVQIEKLQIFLGDVKAESVVKDITNLPGSTGPQGPKGYDVMGGDDKDHGGPSARIPSLDARVELPIVLSSATAVGNNQSITSDVPVFLHDGQFVANVKDHQRKDIWSNPDAMMGALGNSSSPSIGPGGYNQGPGLNTNTVLAVLFGLGAVSGELTKSDIKATSTVYDIKNASVDSSASAVANNISVDLQSDNLSDHVLIADITQFALANVTATSSVKDVSATGYDNMRQLTTATLQSSGNTLDVPVSVPTPWISSTATAVGNNTTINVSGVKTIQTH
jgi:hypothetical protein